MKKIYLYTLLVALLTFAFASCIDDKGNYSYIDKDDVMSVKINDLSDTIVVFRNLALSPALENTKEEVTYTYRWYCWPKTGTKPKTIELGTTKDIDRDISELAPGEYVLIFEITDADRKIYVRRQMTLLIQVTSIQDGWYILKDIDNMTDFDYVSLDKKHYKDILRDYTPNGNMQLKGQAIQIAYQPSQYTHQIIEDGKVIETLSKQKVFHIISDQDYSIFNAMDLVKFKSFADSFFEAPAIVRPWAVQNYLTTYFVNAGKIYGISNSSPNIGLFPYAPVEDEGYEIAETNIISSMSYAMVFDKKWKTFKKFYASTITLSSFAEPSLADPSKPSPTKMDADLLEMMPADVGINGTSFIQSNATGVALMKNLHKDEHYLIKMDMNKAYPFMLIDTLRDSSVPVLKSPIRAALRAGNYVYYTNSSGNELWAYNYGVDIAQRDNLILSLDAGEKITSIQDIYIKDEKTTSIVIATSLAGQKWKFYSYPLVSTSNPTLADTPKEVYEGEGTVRYVLRRRG